MKSFVVRLFFLLLLLALGREMRAQSLAGGSEKSSVQLEALTKKIDEQNTKIDALSQQLLKLEHQIAAIRPGVMIGETTPSSSGSTAAPAPASSSPVASVAGENAHVVTKGETLTSIAKANRVGVQELQKFNHIENDRALQIGQTIMIPPPGSGSPAPNE